MLKAVDTTDVAESAAGDAGRVSSGAQHRAAVPVRFLRAAVQFLLMLAILAGAYVAMERLLASKPVHTARPQVSAAVPVEAAAAIPGDQRPAIRLYGEIAAARSVDIRPAVAGEIVSVTPGLQAGQRVEEDQILFSIDRFNYQGQLTEARANLAQTEAAIAQGSARIAAEREQLEFAQSQLELARADLERAGQLSKSGALTAKQVEDRELIVSQRDQAVSTRRNNLLIEQAGLDQQIATRDRLAWGVRQAERNLENTVVTAPFSGVVRSSDIEAGRIISANEVAVSLYDDTALDVRFTLTDAQYGRVATDSDPLIGRDVDIVWTVGGIDYAYRAKVVRIGAEVASARGGVDVYARLQDGESAVQIRPGAFVEVTVPDRLYREAYRLPETAIYDAGAVYIIADGALQRREVKVAAFDGADVIVTEGLSRGDRVLTTRLSRIENGLKVVVPGDESTETPTGPPAGLRKSPGSN